MGVEESLWYEPSLEELLGCVDAARPR
uniref:LOC554174 protein n=1 Tax=Homo sapiens TaxID=9606 RepID=Q96GL5_HUMAN|nr:LOC554174 protein [Homo sapiens]